MKYSESLRRELAHFQQLVERLQAELDQDHTPGDFRAAVDELRGGLDEVGRAAFLSLVSRCDEAAATIAEGTGTVLRCKQTVAKDWLTLWGPVVVWRRVYQADRGGRCWIPLDERCGMVGRYLTPEWERAAAFLGAQLTPTEVEAAMAELLRQGPSRTAIQHVLTRVGAAAEHQARALATVLALQAPLKVEEADTLVVGWDGTTVPLREPAPRRGRPPERPGVGQAEATPTAWREAGVGMVATYQAGRNASAPASRREVCYFARMPETKMTILINQVAQQTAVTLAAGNFPERVLLADGKREIWRAAAACPVFAGFTQIVDFYHATEHLSRAAEALFGKSTEAAQRWYQRWRHKLQHQPGAVVAVQRSLCYYQQHLPQRSIRWREVNLQRGYFRHNQQRMDYAGYRARGLPIGSGPVEAACKTIVTQRLKRSGMRWTRTGGQQILNLRVPLQSHRWQVFWNWYLDYTDQLAIAA